MAAAWTNRTDPLDFKQTKSSSALFASAIQPYPPKHRDEQYCAPGVPTTLFRGGGSDVPRAQLRFQPWPTAVGLTRLGLLIATTHL